MLTSLGERRSAPRHAASDVPAITGVHLSPRAVEPTLVNVSATGALVQCKTRLLSGTPVTLVFDGSLSVASVKGKVVRCLVATLTPSGLWYHVGIAFEKTIDLELESPTEDPQEHADTTPATPVAVNRW